MLFRALTGAVVLLCTSANADPFSGPYVGLLAGYNHSSGDGTITRPLRPPIGNYSELPPAGFGISTDRFTGTFFAGWGQTTNQFYWGIEGDITIAPKTNMGSVQTPLLQLIPFSAYAMPANFSVSDQSVTATLRGKIGVLTGPSTLLYATGGVIAARTKTEINIHYPATQIGGALIGGSYDSVRGTDSGIGYVVGGGIEQQISNGFFVIVEYQFQDTGSIAFKTVSSTGGRINYSTDTNNHNFRFGALYRFATTSP